VICAWCSKSWDVEKLRRDGWELLSDRQAVDLDILRQFAHARSGDEEFQREASRHVYVSFTGGKGCPSAECGFEHGPGDGPYRQQQLQELETGDATDGQS
jgi:hypothetical protein